MSGAPKQEPLSPEAVAFVQEADRSGYVRSGLLDLGRLFDAHRVNAHASLVAALTEISTLIVDPKADPAFTYSNLCEAVGRAKAALAAAQKGESRD